MKEKGFTLIELMVVMAVIGILAGLTLTGFTAARKTARDGQRKADLEQVRSALEMCRSDTGSYPAGTLVSGNNITCGGATYMQIPNDPGGFRYYYTRTGASSYRLCAHLETGGGSTGCGSNCSGTCNYEVNQP
ncbi:MAG TPA: type II secretion system protein [Nevskiaceae bacterium]|nr:type II secretion system protein [Nevskiaceae bacterium]